MGLCPVANTYIETVGSHADSLHLAIKRVTASDIYSEYFKTVEILGNRFQLSEKDVVLAFDYTEENFYGDVQGFWESEMASDQEVNQKEIEFIKLFRSNDPIIGYKRWPKF